MRELAVLAALALVVVVGIAGGRALLGLRVVSAGAAPAPLVDGGLSYDTWASTLADFVDADGRVDYPALAADDGRLRSFCATLAAFGPRTQPARFADQADRLAYYINAYNALTMLAVVDRWPIGSVFDVHGPVNPVDGFGFFWAQRFQLDGRGVNLHRLENGILRREFADARIHAAINCASGGCPVLSNEVFVAERLDEQLDRASRRFATAPHVVVEPADRAIVLSAIYQWYAADFVAHATSLGAGASVLDWAAHYATDELAAELRAARDAGYEIRFADYDWRVNARRSRPEGQ